MVAIIRDLDSGTLSPLDFMKILKGSEDWVKLKAALEEVIDGKP